MLTCLTDHFLDAGVIALNISGDWQPGETLIMGSPTVCRPLNAAQCSLCYHLYVCLIGHIQTQKNFIPRSFNLCNSLKLVIFKGR